MAVMTTVHPSELGIGRRKWGGWRSSQKACMQHDCMSSALKVWRVENIMKHERKREREQVVP
jgi:hypothetical protein